MKRELQERHRPRGFTLLEMMVASVIAFVIVAAAAELASAMARSVKRAEEQGDLGVRAALSQAFLIDLASGAAYNWNVAHSTGASSTTGSLGPGGCAASTGMCAANGEMPAPLRICNGTTVDRATCNQAPSTTAADALWTYVPRDSLIEAMSIVDRSGTPLTTACDATNVPATVTFSVRGTNSVAWGVDDLVLVARNGHATVGTVKAVFAVGNDPAVSRDLQLDVGTGTTLDKDDGGSGTGCNAQTSLRGAKVMRIRHVVVKHDPTTRALLYGHRAQGAAAFTFETIVGDLDDFQLQLDVARVPAAGSPGICTSNTSEIFANAALSGGPCNAERLNGDASAGSLVRVIGVRAGLLLRTAVETQAVTVTTTGLFDRTGTTFSDKRIRRQHFVYMGLPNAANL